MTPTSESADRWFETLHPMITINGVPLRLRARRPLDFEDRWRRMRARRDQRERDALLNAWFWDGEIRA